MTTRYCGPTTRGTTCFVPSAIYRRYVCRGVDNICAHEIKCDGAYRNVGFKKCMVLLCQYNRGICMENTKSLESSKCSKK